MLALNQVKEREKLKRLNASKARLQAVLMWEKPTRQLMGSLVKDGHTHSPMTTVSRIWEITTFVGIRMGLHNPRCGAIPRILKFCIKIAQFPSVPL